MTIILFNVLNRVAPVEMGVRRICKQGNGKLKNGEMLNELRKKLAQEKMFAEDLMNNPNYRRIS